MVRLFDDTRHHVRRGLMVGQGEGVKRIAAFVEGLHRPEHRYGADLTIRTLGLPYRFVKLRPGKTAALDLGEARVGVAISDELGLMAHPRPPIDARNRKVLLDAITRFVREEEVGYLLVGLPLEMSGRHGPAAEKAVLFAQQVAESTGLDVELVDERLTTVEASRQLRASGVDARRGKKKVDGVAAAVMLQSWLDGRGSR